MSNQSSQSSHAHAARRKATPGKRRAQQKPSTDPAHAELEAKRALLADPETIATGAKPPAAVPRAARAPIRPAPSGPTRARKVRHAPARVAAHALQETPVQATTARSTEALPAAMAPTPTPIPRTALLDATRAQRLAREARLRERDSREALVRARALLEDPPMTLPAASARRTLPAPATPAAQWQRHPLTPTPASGSEVAPLSPQAVRSAPPAAERALAAELREARATLAIARETTQVQRDEIARLRTALAQAPSAPPAAEPTELLVEIAHLAERAQQLEIDLDHRERERSQLIEALAAGERERAERAHQLAALQDRYDVQEQALEQARCQFELERRRHTEAQATLDRLRAALSGIDGDPASPSAAAPADPIAPIPTTALADSADSAPYALVVLSASSTPSAPSVPDAPVASATPSAQVANERESESAAAADTSRVAGLFRAPIFELWREGQIRRHFGPLGLDTTADLLREPLARRRRAGGPALPILVLGAGAAAKSPMLSEALTRSGTPRFALHVADPLSPIADLPVAPDRSAESLRHHPVPESAGELETLVRSVAPAVIVVRDFLTAQRDLEPWLAVLERATRAGACLVLLEETGRGAVVPGDEIEAIGQRIWELLPERYTRDPVTETPVPSYREAFARRVAPPRNGLLNALRSRFELELCAQFGFLAEAFVSGPVAGCFDADAARDRRFLEQITDLDDRRVEAGNTAALHLIARVDPLAPR